MKSSLKLIKEIPWKTELVVEKIIFDPNLFEIHKQRIDKIFEKSPKEVRDQQLQNILLRDTLFNKAMEIVVQSYEFKLDSKEVEAYIEPLKKSFPKNPEMSDKDWENKIKDIANKLIQKQLIFNDIAIKDKIVVEKDETMKILEEYHKTTNMPIKDILNDQEKLTGAVSALLEEKITAHIINKFPRDLTKLYDNMQKDIDMNNQQQTQETKKDEKKSKRK